MSLYTLMNNTTAEISLREATLSDIKAYLSEHGLAAVPQDSLPGEWISVEDRWPEVGHPVIAYGIYEGEINGTGSLMVGAGVYDGNLVVDMEADAYTAQLIGITHWQPLPSPPVK